MCLWLPAGGGMTPFQAVGLVAVGAIASGINAVAGGGSLLSFPYLVGLHIPDVMANATNSVGLWPGSLAGGLGFAKRLGGARESLRTLVAPTVVGSTVGAFLLLHTSDAAFRRVIPFLILLAAVLLLLQPRVKALVGGRVLPRWAAPLLQLFIAVYGGFFGAGMGIMMLALLALTLDGDLHELNAVKNWLSLLINVVCSAVFLVKRLVLPLEGGLLVVGSLVGGYAAARLSQRFDPARLRPLIAVYGLGTAAWFFWRAFGTPG